MRYLSVFFLFSFLNLPGCILLTGFANANCGDGLLDAGEDCDDANNQNGDGCDANCLFEDPLANCGNNIEDEGEECDDGNVIDGDGCDSNCTLTACENGIASPGEFCFISQTEVVGDEPRALVLEDFDNDNDLDIATVNFASGDVSVLLYIVDNLFDNAQNFVSNAESNSIAAGDIDNDGILDLAVSVEDDGGGADPVVLLFGEGDGTFANNEAFDITDKQNAVALGDFDEDEELDLAVADQNTSVVAVALQEDFTSVNTFDVGIPPITSLVVGDFGGGGDDLDIVTSNESSNDVSFLEGKGDGSFESENRFSLDGGLLPQQVIAVDIDKDGDLDLITANKGSDGISVLRNDGDAGFAAQQFLLNDGVGGQLDGDPSSVAAGDLNNDGLIDIVSANLKSNNITVFFQDENGEFVPQEPLTVGDEPRFVAIGDINGDLVPDIIVANQKSNDLTIFFSVP